MSARTLSHVARSSILRFLVLPWLCLAVASPGLAGPDRQDSGLSRVVTKKQVLADVSCPPGTNGERMRLGLPLLPPRRRWAQ